MNWQRAQIFFELHMTSKRTWACKERGWPLGGQNDKIRWDMRACDVVESRYETRSLNDCCKSCPPDSIKLEKIEGQQLFSSSQSLNFVCGYSWRQASIKFSVFAKIMYIPVYFLQKPRREAHWEPIRCCISQVCSWPWVWLDFKR